MLRNLTVTMVNPIDKEHVSKLIQLLNTHQATYFSLPEGDQKIDVRKKLKAAEEKLGSMDLVHELTLECYKGLLGRKDDDDVFKWAFKFFNDGRGYLNGDDKSLVDSSFFGITYVCEGESELQLAGRFGMPYPDEKRFCELLGGPVIENILEYPYVQMYNPIEDIGAGKFDYRIRVYLSGMSMMAIPLIPTPGELIGLLLLYRKEGKRFTPMEQLLGRIMSEPVGIAVIRND